MALCCNAGRWPTEARNPEPRAYNMIDIFHSCIVCARLLWKEASPLEGGVSSGLTFDACGTMFFLSRMYRMYVYCLRDAPQWHAPCLSKVGETIVSYMKAARRKISATSAPLSYRRRLFAAVGLPSSALIHEDLLCIIPGLKDDISVVTEGVVAVWESLASASRLRAARRASSALHGSRAQPSSTKIFSAPFQL